MRAGIRLASSFCFGRRQVRRAGLRSPDGVIGVIETGSLDTSLLLRAFANLPEGTWELVTHPGYADDDLRAERTRLVESRERERDLLMSPDIRAFLDRERIEIINYRQLAEAPPRHT